MGISLCCVPQKQEINEQQYVSLAELELASPGEELIGFDPFADANAALEALWEAQAEADLRLFGG